IAHDHLSADNHPVYFREIVARAAAHDLTYLDDAYPHITAAHATTAHAASARKMGGEDVVLQEQYFDFLINREFRQTLFCRREASPSRITPPDATARLLFATRAKPAGPIDVRRKGATSFEHEGDGVTTDHPLTKAALVHLEKAWPRAVAFP